jgi:tetratricopeptide (TPR) repeat protein
MLQVIREFALDKLLAGSDAEAIRRRHAEHVMAFAERAGPELVGFEMRDWNHRLRRDGENLRSALRWALEKGELDIGLRTASAIWRFWHYWGVPREGRDWVQALLHKPGARPEIASRAKGLAALASLVYWLGDMTGADELYSQALDLYRQLGDETRVTETIDAMCWTAVGQGDFEGAMARVQEAMGRYRNIGDRAGVARMDAWIKTGGFFMGFGVPADEALAASNEVIVTAREQGNAWNMINAQGEIAGVYRRLGDIPRAVEAFRTTTELYVGLGYLGMLPWLKLLASMEISRGDANRAATLAAIAQRAVEELGGELPEEITQVGNPLEDARGLLSEEAYVAAVARGRAMGFEEAVAYALETN